MTDKDISVLTYLKNAIKGQDIPLAEIKLLDTDNLSAILEQLVMDGFHRIQVGKGIFYSTTNPSITKITKLF